MPHARVPACRHQQRVHRDACTLGAAGPAGGGAKGAEGGGGKKACGKWDLEGGCAGGAAVTLIVLGSLFALVAVGAAFASSAGSARCITTSVIKASVPRGNCSTRCVLEWSEATWSVERL